MKNTDILCVMLGLAVVFGLHAQTAEAPAADAFDPATEGESSAAVASPEVPTADRQELTFPIDAYSIRGNSILTVEELESVLIKFRGPNSTQKTVDGAREALERMYHEKGYLTVTVFVPQQEVAGGLISMQVIEGIIGKIVVTGNKNYSRQSILDRIPSVKSGQLLFLPDLVADLTRVNRNSNLTVTPALSPGLRMGETDIELQVVERSPLNVSLELNNHVPEDDTSLIRAAFSVAYNSLWRREHSVAFQYQTAPDELSKLQVLGLTYSLPSPFRADDTIIAFGFLSFTSAEVANTFQTQGAGNNIGARYVFLLPIVNYWAQTLSVGVDYKGYTDKYDFEESDTISEQYIEYWPIDVTYNLSTRWDWGRIGIRSGFAFQPRFMVDVQQFEDRRDNAYGNYVIAKAGIDSSFVLAPFLNLSVEGEGRVADQALIPNEQFSVGGAKSVRGYYEGKGAGDSGWKVSLELSSPFQLFKTEDGGAKMQILPFVFTEAAGAYLIDALKGESDSVHLWSTGLGVRLDAIEHISGEFSIGLPLMDSNRIQVDLPIIQASVRAYY